MTTRPCLAIRVLRAFELRLEMSSQPGASRTASSSARNLVRLRERQAGDFLSRRHTRVIQATPSRVTRRRDTR